MEPEPASSRCAKTSSACRSSSSVSSSTNQEPPSGSATWHDARLLGDDLLGPQRQAGRVLGRESQRLVEGVGVQALGPPEHPGQRLDGHPDQVHLGLLGRQRDARRLGVEAQLGRAPVGRAVAVTHPAGPDATSGPVLGDLLEEVDVGVEEEAEPRSEVVDAPCRPPSPPRRRRTRWPA